MFATRVRDMQCGFKAARAEIVRDLLPAIEDEGWFFDTELLLLAERNGLRIHQVPVDWVDDPDSRVNISQTARDDMRGALRVARAFATGRGRVSLTHPRAVSDDDFGRRLVSFGVIRGAIGAIAAVAALCLTWAFARVMQFLLLNRTIPTRQVP
jgi:hypothetical protein